MRKLKLSLEELTIESFATGEEMKGAGTVKGQMLFTRRCDTADDTCFAAYTCYEYDTCGGYNTCDFESCGECGSYKCATGVESCGDVSCIYTCEVGC